ncbi:MAG: GTP-binding protein [Pseudomonadota bacterium]
MPLTLLTGFLGSGKTTLLSRYLQSTNAADTAVIINEYGAVQIDGDLVTFAADTTDVRTTTGCLCCTISGDVKEALLELAQGTMTSGQPGFTHLIIETTGLADPVSLFHAITTDAEICEFYEHSRTVTLIDAVHGENYFERHAECRQQIALADTIVLTKTDLINDPVSQRETDTFISVLRKFNPEADICSSASVNVEDLFKATKSDTMVRNLGFHPSSKHNFEDQHHHHGVNSFTVSFDQKVDCATLKLRLESLSRSYGADLLRIKGMVHAESPDGEIMVMVQCVGSLIQFEEMQALPSRIKSQLVFITNALSHEEAQEHLGLPSFLPQDKIALAIQ